MGEVIALYDQIEGDLRKWDDAELVRGRRRPWKGPDPNVIPVQLVEELRKRMTGKAEAKMLGYVPAALRALEAFLSGEEKPTAAQIRAIELVLDRALGKTPDKVEVSQEAPWQTQMKALVMSLSANDESSSRPTEAQPADGTSGGNGTGNAAGSKETLS